MLQFWQVTGKHNNMIHRRKYKTKTRFIDTKMEKDGVWLPLVGPTVGIMPLQTRNYSAQLESNQQFHYLKKQSLHKVRSIKIHMSSRVNLSFFLQMREMCFYRTGVFWEVKEKKRFYQTPMDEEFDLNWNSFVDRNFPKF